MDILPEKNGPWTIRSWKIIHDSQWLRLTEHGVTQPDGSEGQYGVVQFKNLAIGVLPLDEDGNTWIVGQHRFALNEYSWELPEGGGALDTAPLETAKRELREETGLSASDYHPLCFFFTSNSVTNERAYGFLAWGLQEGEASPEPSEELELRKIPFRELFEDVISGKITDGFTITMVLMAAEKARKGLLPEPVATILRAQLD
jgi:8-oxo-dGTP pyrophosphatase MutT (NUDIX family)